MRLECSIHGSSMVVPLGLVIERNPAEEVKEKKRERDIPVYPIADGSFLVLKKKRRNEQRKGQCM